MKESIFYKAKALFALLDCLVNNRLNSLEDSFLDSPVDGQPPSPLTCYENYRLYNITDCLLDC